MTNDNWNFLFDLVIVTVSQSNTKPVALELIGMRDFFPQSMPVPNDSNEKQRCTEKPTPYKHNIHAGTGIRTRDLELDDFSVNPTILRKHQKIHSLELCDLRNASLGLLLLLSPYFNNRLEKIICDATYLRRRYRHCH